MRLTRTRARTVSARSAREILLDYPAMDTQIPLAELCANSFGTTPTDLGRYADLIAELKS